MRPSTQPKFIEAIIKYLKLNLLVNSAQITRSKMKIGVGFCGCIHIWYRSLLLALQKTAMSIITSVTAASVATATKQQHLCLVFITSAMISSHQRNENEREKNEIPFSLFLHTELSATHQHTLKIIHQNVVRLNLLHPKILNTPSHHFLIIS